MESNGAVVDVRRKMVGGLDIASTQSCQTVVKLLSGPGSTVVLGKVRLPLPAQNLEDVCRILRAHGKITFSVVSPKRVVGSLAFQLKAMYHGNDLADLIERDFNEEYEGE
jgi:hypothetical protein